MQNWIKYGFETVAVTVGILGAFALESWKDNRHEEKELQEIYITIADDLHTDVQALDTLLLRFEWRISIMTRILTEPVSMDEWINNDSLKISFVGYPDFQESLRGLDLLNTKIASTGESGILASRISSFYKTRLLRNKVSGNEAANILYDNYIYWMDNGVWLSASMIEGDHSLLAKYVEDNPYFRNRLSVYWVVLNNHHNSLKKYKEEGAKLAEEINGTAMSAIYR